MANPLMLKVIVDDKGNPVLKDMQTNIGRIGKEANKTGTFLRKVFLSGIMLQGMYKFKQAIAASTREVMEFNKVFKQVEGITKTSGRALEVLKAKTIAVSNVTEHTATALGKVALQVSKMGFSLDESLKVIPHLADLATSSVADLTTATQVAVQTMKSFQMPATEMAHIVNVIQGTVSQTALDFEDFAEAMKFVAPIAKTMSISLEETAAMIGILGDVGIKGSLGGTTLKNMFLNIMRPSDDVRKILEKMNWEGKNFTEILRNMHQAGIPVRDFLETFNRRAVAGSLALADLNEKVDTLRESLEKDEIVVADVAAVIREAWIPQLKMLRNAFVNTFITMGEILDKTDLGVSINSITVRLIEFQEWLRENPEQVERFAKSVAILAFQVTHLATSGFEIIIKHMEALVRITKVFMLIKLFKHFGFINKNALVAAAGIRTATGAMMGFQAAIPIIGQATIAIYALGEAFKWMANRAIDAEKAVIKATWGTEVTQVTKQIEAAEKFNIALKEIQETTGKAQDPWGFYIRSTEEVNTQINNLMDTFAKDFGMKREFFEQAKNFGDAFIKSLKEKLGDAEDAAAKAKKILDGLFKIPKGKEDEKKKAAKAGKDIMKSYMEAMFRVSDEMSGSLKLGVDITKVVAMYTEQLRSIRTIISKFGVPATPRPAEMYEQMFTTPVKFETAGMGQIGQFAKPLGGIGIGLERQQKELEDIKKFRDKKVKLWEGYFEELKTLQDNFAVYQEEQRLEEFEKLKEYIWNQVDAYIEAAQTLHETVGIFQDIAFDKMQSKHKKELDLFEERARIELQLVENNAYKKAITEKRLQSERAKILKKQEEAEKELNKKRKTWAIVEVAINTAVAITNALRSVAFPASLVVAGLYTALGIAQTAAILAQEEFFYGGFTGHGDPREPAGIVHKKEYVIPHDKVEALGGASEIDKMIENRVNESIYGGRTINVFVDNFIGTEEYEREFYMRMEEEAQRW